MVGGEERGGVAGEGKENFVEHGGGPRLLYTSISYEDRKGGKGGTGTVGMGLV